MFKEIKAVLWGFLGVRTEEGRKEDFKLNILHIIIIGIIGLFIFIALLIGIIKFLVL